jgi:hypothetical protein
MKYRGIPMHKLLAALTPEESVRVAEFRRWLLDYKNAGAGYVTNHAARCGIWKATAAMRERAR